MRRVLSTVLAVALLLGLGALAVLALPNATASLAEAPAVSAAAPEFEPEAVDASLYNVIGMPLDSANQFATNIPALPFNSDGLADLIGSSVTQVLRWNPWGQTFDTWNPMTNRGVVSGTITSTAFPLAVGGAYWVLVSSNAPAVVSFVGNVPEAGSVHSKWVAGTSGCSYNEFTVPLDQATLTDADLLGAAIGGVTPTAAQQVLQWNASRQQFNTWNPNTNRGVYNGAIVTVPWVTAIGYPYQVCVTSAINGVNWP